MSAFGLENLPPKGAPVWWTGEAESGNVIISEAEDQEWDREDLDYYDDDLLYYPELNKKQAKWVDYYEGWYPEDDNE